MVMGFQNYASLPSALGGLLGGAKVQRVQVCWLSIFYLHNYIAEVLI